MFFSLSDCICLSLIYQITYITQRLISKTFVGGTIKENFTSFCMLCVFKNSLRCLWFKMFGGPSSEFHSTNTTTESPQIKNNVEKVNRRQRLWREQNWEMKMK